MRRGSPGRLSLPGSPTLIHSGSSSYDPMLFDSSLSLSFSGLGLMSEEPEEPEEPVPVNPPATPPRRSIRFDSPVLPASPGSPTMVPGPSSGRPSKPALPDVFWDDTEVTAGPSGSSGTLSFKPPPEPPPNQMWICKFGSPRVPAPTTLYTPTRWTCKGLRTPVKRYIEGKKWEAVTISVDDEESDDWDVPALTTSNTFSPRS